MEIIKAIAVTLCSPLVLASFFLLIGFLASLRKLIRVKAFSYGFSVTVLLVCSQPYFAELLLYPLEHLNRDQPKLENATSLIYPLACFYNGKGKVPEISRWAECSLQRLTAAARLYHEYGGQILVTGGKNRFHETVSYAKKARELLCSLGVNEQDIFVIEHGGTTAVEIASAAEHLESQPVLIISSATHIRRLALLTGERETISFYPVDYLTLGDLTPRIELPSIFALEASRRAFYEYMAFTKDYFMTMRKLSSSQK
ncbi:hypothetical protein Thiowin_02668 [Thiorhodovibrio winogradskyi]|uniref:DUF218 domain-containing protein n=1 Tax=Thiorhodovibrio winogradskyi TaxID=77007 RepID=A0ABZ0SC10_9GAMM|nr:YdcF family protein [Thiorhodovibrio winogradskyi]